MTNLGFKAKEVHKIPQWNSSPFLFQIINKTFYPCSPREGKRWKGIPELLE
jgi:hypothetical protein